MAGIARATFRLVSWCPFFWQVIGCAEVASGDLVVDDILICAIGTEVFAMVKRPTAMTEREWGELADNPSSWHVKPIPTRSPG